MISKVTKFQRISLILAIIAILLPSCSRDRDEYLNKKLFKAVANGKYSKVNSILEKHPEMITSRDESGRTLLHVAVADDQIDIVKFFIDKGIDVNTQLLESGWSPLYMASGLGYGDIVDLLVSNGAIIDEKDQFGDTPLHYATLNAHNYDSARIIKLLVDNGANVNAKNDSGDTPLHNASSCRWETTKVLDAIRVLVENGADISEIGGIGCTPLEWAIGSGDQKRVDLLISLGAQPSPKNIETLKQIMGEKDGKVDLTGLKVNKSKDGKISLEVDR